MNKHSRDYDAPYYPEWDDDGGYIVPDDEDDAPNGGVRESRKPTHDKPNQPCPAPTPPSGAFYKYEKPANSGLFLRKSASKR